MGTHGVRPGFQVGDYLVIYERDAGLCGICGSAVDPYDVSIDHIQPLAKGGAHEESNWRLAHRMCNCRKRSRLPDDPKLKDLIGKPAGNSPWRKPRSERYTILIGLCLTEDDYNWLTEYGRSHGGMPRTSVLRYLIHEERERQAAAHASQSD